jgi:uncharacterized protein RhaS with RHS repeats
MRDASGQMYMRNRYYDPASGQFTQPDPIGIAGGMNVYGFAAGDPVSFSDPYGLCIWPWLKRCWTASSDITLGDALFWGGIIAAASDEDERIAGPARRVMQVASRVQRDADALQRRRYREDQVFWDRSRRNAFRHIYGSCTLARELGAADARSVTSAHETTLRSGDARQEADRTADSQNNETGIKEGTNPANEGKSCEQIADQQVYADNYAAFDW